jgi:hypothetical protein
MKKSQLCDAAPGTHSVRLEASLELQLREFRSQRNDLPDQVAPKTGCSDDTNACRDPLHLVFLVRRETPPPFTPRISKVDIKRFSARRFTPIGSDALVSAAILHIIP